MGKHKPRFRHTDTFDGLETSSGEAECAVAGEADVFGSENDHAAGDEFGIFAGLNHAGKVIEGGVSVAAAHGFDKSRNCIVMVVAFFVVTGEFATGGLDDGIARDVRSEGDGEFEVTEGTSGVAAGKFGEVVEGIVVDSAVD